MARGDIGAVIDTLEFDTDCWYPSLVHVSGDIYAVAYAGLAGDGFLKTVNIDSKGNIGTIIDTLDFDTTTVVYCHLVHISGNAYAVAYQSLPTGDGFLKTVNIDSNGNIGTVIATLEFDTTSCNYPFLIHISGNVYAIAYQGPGNDGFLKTMTIDSDGNIGSVIDTLDFETDTCYYPHLVHISGAIYAIAYKGPGGDGFLKTMSIDSEGNIGSVIDTLEFDTSLCDYPFLIHISGNVYAIAYRGPGADGFLKTMSIANSGDIGAVIDSLEFDTDYCSEPHLIHILKDAYAIAYRGSDGDGWLKTVRIATNGDIGAVIDTLEFDTDYCHDPSLIHVSGLGPVRGDIYAIAYQGPDTDGWLATMDIETPVYKGNPNIDQLIYQHVERMGR